MRLADKYKYLTGDELNISDVRIEYVSEYKGIMFITKTEYLCHNEESCREFYNKIEHIKKSRSSISISHKDSCIEFPGNSYYDNDYKKKRKTILCHDIAFIIQSLTGHYKRMIYLTEI